MSEWKDVEWQKKNNVDRENKLAEIKARHGSWEAYWLLEHQTASDDRRFLLEFGKTAFEDIKILLYLIEDMVSDLDLAKDEW